MMLGSKQRAVFLLHKKRYFLPKRKLPVRVCNKTDGLVKEPLIYSAAHLRHIFSRLLLAEKLDVHPVHLEFFAIAGKKICTESVPPH